MCGMTREEPRACDILYLLSRYMRSEGPLQWYFLPHDHIPSQTGIAITIGPLISFPPDR